MSYVRIAVASVLALPLTAVYSQDRGASKSTVAEQTGIEEVVVTARRREESVQQTPVSVAVMGSEALRMQSIDTFNKLNDAVPNLRINPGLPGGGGSSSQIFIRGVGQIDYAAPGEPGVGVYVDDVYVSRSPGGNSGILDVERIEVLRGPQGTLYGRNTIGGAVKVITKRPTGEFYAEAGLTVGDYNRIDAQGVIDVPFNDVVGARLAVGTRNRDGLGHNGIGQDLGEEEKNDVRATVSIRANDKVDIVIRGDYHTQRQAGPAGSSSHFAANATTPIINNILVPQTEEEFGLPPPPFDVWGPAYAYTMNQCGKCVYSNLGGNTTKSRDWADLWGASATVDVDFDVVQFKSITAYRYADVWASRDLDMSPFRVIEVSNPETSKQISQEFQLYGSTDHLQWLAGVYGFNEKVDYVFNATQLGGLYAATGRDNSSSVPGDIDSNSYAIFGEGTYALSDRWSATLGARATWDDKEFTFSVYRPESGVLAIPNTTLKDSWSEITPKIGVEFQANHELMFYGNASKGYKAGGFASRPLGGTLPTAFDPEHLTAYELGMKSRWADERITLNLAAFYNDYKDIQLTTVTTVGNGQVDTKVANAGKGRVIGGELEAAWRPIPALYLSVSAGYQDAEYRELGDAAINAGVRLENEFPNAPAFTATAAAQYDLEVADAGTLSFRIDGTHSDEYYLDAVNTPWLHVNAYELLNARIGFKSSSGHWEVSAFGTNLTDKVVKLNGVQVLALSLVETYYTRPREWGASVVYRY
jgi:iron complex outermembrane receptor protein